MVAFTALLALLTSTAFAVAGRTDEKNHTRIYSSVTNTRIGNVCIGPGRVGGPGVKEFKDGNKLILQSCIEDQTAVKFKDGKIVFASGNVAEYDMGVNIIPWVRVVPPSGSPAQVWTVVPSDSPNYFKLKNADGLCLALSKPPLPGPSPFIVAKCDSTSYQDFLWWSED